MQNGHFNSGRETRWQSSLALKKFSSANWNIYITIPPNGVFALMPRSTGGAVQNFTGKALTSLICLPISGSNIVSVGEERLTENVFKDIFNYSILNYPFNLFKGLLVI